VRIKRRKRQKFQAVVESGHLEADLNRETDTVKCVAAGRVPAATSRQCDSVSTYGCGHEYTRKTLEAYFRMGGLKCSNRFETCDARPGPSYSQCCSRLPLCFPASFLRPCKLKQ